MSFEPRLRLQIEQAREDIREVLLINSAVKRNREDLEVVVHNQSKILDSPINFIVDQSTLMSSSQAESNMEITLLGIMRSS